jgi:hypothetical protein
MREQKKKKGCFGSGFTIQNGEMQNCCGQILD